jgi:hypothetical protein
LLFYHSYSIYRYLNRFFIDSKKQFKLFICLFNFIFSFRFCFIFSTAKRVEIFFYYNGKSNTFGPFVRTKSKSPGSLFIVAKSLLAKANAIWIRRLFETAIVFPFQTHPQRNKLCWLCCFSSNVAGLLLAWKLSFIIF